MAKKDCLLFFLVTITTFCLPFPAFAQQTAYGRITSLQTGSLGGPPVLGSLGRIEGDDTLAVNLDAPFVNSGDSNPAVSPALRPPPTPCKITTGGYALDPKDTGVKLNESVLLSAYLAGRKVSLYLSGCVFDKPRIVSVSMSAANN
jgi:hypothetical protein